MIGPRSLRLRQFSNLAPRDASLFITGLFSLPAPVAHPPRILSHSTHSSCSLEMPLVRRHMTASPLLLRDLSLVDGLYLFSFRIMFDFECAARLSYVKALLVNVLFYIN